METPNQHLTFSQNGLLFLEAKEGLRTKAYQDSIGVWTIGIGTTIYPTGKKVKKGDVISTKQAYDMCALQIATTYGKAVNDLVTAPLAQHQYDALVSFCYNLGTGALAKSTLLKKVNAKPHDATIAKVFVKWCTAGGKQIAGLLIRRNQEADLYRYAKLPKEITPAFAY